MNHVASGVKENVSVVSVFDLQNVTEKRVANHGSHKVLLGSLVSPDVLRILGGDLQRFLSCDAFEAGHWGS